ncbi:MAG: hypothetical protein WKG01_37400 [Kofleriaceae bacterium]
MTELHDAIEGEDWPRALELALTVWRATRAVEVAVLIEDLDRLLPRLDPPRAHRELQQWWREHALAFDPIALPSLIASAAHRPGGPGQWSEVRARWLSLGFEAITTFERHTTAPAYALDCMNWIERVIALVSWPEDPRVIPILVTWFITPPVTLAPQLLAAMMKILARRLAAVTDARVRPQLAACITEPRGRVESIREHQGRLAARIVEEIDRRTRPTDPALAAAIARCAAAMPAREDTTQSDARIAVLWAGVIRDPDDGPARMVLADALVERSDPRGELIVLQGRGAGPRAEQLLRRHFKTWMGDAALVMPRKLCTFRDGMLAEARLGTANTPPWAWRKIAGHRELATLREVRPSYAPADEYAELIATLPNLRTILFDAPEMVLRLAAIDARLSVTAVDYVEYNPTLPAIRDLPALSDVCASLARCAPALETLHLGMLHGSTQDELAAVVPTLAEQFPRLRQILVAGSNFFEREEDRRVVARVPRVEIY